MTESRTMAGEERRWASAYLALQAAGTVAWWMGVSLSDRVRGWFELDDANRDALNAFIAADAAIFLLGSVVAAVAIAREWTDAPRVVAWVAGGVLYATAYLAVWVLLTGQGGIGLVPMLAATAATSLIAVRTRTSES